MSELEEQSGEDPGCRDLVCTRRRLLALAGATAGASALELVNPTMAFAAGRSAGDLLVVVTLGGGADGLSLVPPMAERAYLSARPDLAIRESKAVPLDRQFGLHPGLKPLMPFWRSKQLAVVHAVGDSDGTRSHFEAMTAMERGVNRVTSVSTGWVDRHMTARGLSTDAFPALAIARRSPGTLTGPAPDLAATDIRNLRVRVPRAQEAVTERALAEMHAGVAGPVAGAARQTLSAIGRFRRFRDVEQKLPAAYPEDSLGRALRQVALVARARIGLQVATVSSGGWDMHAGMGTAGAGYAYDHISRLGRALAAFAHDLGPLLRTTTIVTVSEFGRRVSQNGSNGLDHGHGSAWFVLGGGIRGGRVYGRWPGLAPQRLDDGDLRVTTDYRDVLGELVRRRLGGGSLRTVFPDHRVHELGLARQR